MSRSRRAATSTLGGRRGSLSCFPPESETEIDFLVLGRRKPGYRDDAFTRPKSSEFPFWCCDVFARNGRYATNAAIAHHRLSFSLKDRNNVGMISGGGSD